MKLVIAEKHELAQKIAAAFSKTPKKDNSINAYIAGDYTVAWCQGHILELKSPSDYNDQYKRWDIKDLPLNILKKAEFKKSSAKHVQSILKTLPNLIKKASLIIHAGDPDEEGQRIVDNVLIFFNASKSTPIKRVAINDTNPKLVKAAFEKMEDNNNKKWQGMGKKGLARAVGDQLYGLTLTRAASILTKSTKTISVGRVQSPTLALVVKRFFDNKNFVSTPFYEVHATFIFNGKEFSARCNAPENYLNENGRITDKNLAEELSGILKNLDNDPAPVISAYEKGSKSHKHPLGYDLLKLQVEAGKRYGISADKVMEITQSLRDKSAITYNRSDCEYLNVINHADAPSILACIAHNVPSLNEAIEKTDTSITSRIWNDKEVAKSAHHAIIPTEKKLNPSELSTEEKIIYGMIANRYVLQFLPEKISMATEFTVNYGGYLFNKATSYILEKGWEILLYLEEPESTDEKEAQDSWPELKQGDQGQTTDIELKTGKTTPPKLFTDSSLLETLPKVDDLVEDEELKQFLIKKNKNIPPKQRGIGTPATRGDILKKLKSSGYVDINRKKEIIPTDLGIEIYNLLPDSSKKIDMSALWQLHMSNIAQGNLTITNFLEFISTILEDDLDYLKSQDLNISTTAKSVPCRCGDGEVVEKQNKKNKSKFWCCNACQNIYPDLKGKPDFERKSSQLITTNSKGESFDCLHCKSPLAKKENDEKIFWTCSNYKECKSYYADIGDRPLLEKCQGDSCEGHLSIRTYKNSRFWGCSDYKKGCSAKYYSPKDDKDLTPRLIVDKS